MEVEEIERVLERIWDLHDKLSDAIHSISRSHFLLNKSKKPNPLNDAAAAATTASTNAPPPQSQGFVFVKDNSYSYSYSDSDAVFASSLHEAKSLNSIRSALENLEDQLDFFHTVQMQQQAERDAAIARLEQSRIILAMRLAEHRGKKYKVIEEALAFVGDVQDASRFVSPENLYGVPGKNIDGQGANKSNVVFKVLVSSFDFMKRSLAADHLGGLLSNVAVFAVGMMALLHLNQVAYKGHPDEFEALSYNSRNAEKVSHLNVLSTNGNLNQLDVMLAMG